MVEKTGDAFTDVVFRLYELLVLPEEQGQVVIRDEWYKKSRGGSRTRDNSADRGERFRKNSPTVQRACEIVEEELGQYPSEEMLKFAVDLIYDGDGREGFKDYSNENEIGLRVDDRLVR